jgi:hypothetical protein
VATQLTVQWVAVEDGAAPSALARQALVAWAEARGFRLMDAVAVPLAVIAPDLGVADTVEAQLEQAHDAITAQDASGADAALSKAEAVLHAHPELPQAAWLLAEVLRTRATRWSRLSPGAAGDLPRSRQAWARAASLDGGRARGVGEGAAASSPSAVLTTSHASLSFDGEHAADARDLEAFHVFVDDAPVPRDGATLAAAPGEHQLTATRARDGALVWAAWVAVADGAMLRVALPQAAACSHEDLRESRTREGAVVATGVLCSDWVFVEESVTTPGDLSLATCSGATCGPLVRWHVGPIGPVLADEHRHHGEWPAWATWTIVAASAAVITGATLAASGVFRPTHDEPVFTTGGLHVSSSSALRLRFGD